MGHIRTEPSSYLFSQMYLRKRVHRIGPTQVRRVPKFGALAQLGERLICIQEVRSSILLGSTKLLPGPNKMGR